jgi:mannose-6-phosphate isomerase-like protein (cupin superfamily)/N-acetylglutamate synthase-like GNAT family acetyltransferase
MNISTHNAEHYTWGANCDGWHLLKSDPLSVIQERMPAGTSEQLHAHRFAQQLFYILSGTATFDIDGNTHTISANESVHIKPNTLHKIYNQQAEDLIFMVISQPKAHGDRIEIINYSDDLKEHIKTLNVEWLTKYFKVEPNDEVQLSNPKEEILDKGGSIYYAKHNNEIVGTVSLLKIDDTYYELGKMAVTEHAKGLGIGKLMIEHMIAVATQMGIKRLVLYSNTSLSPAIHLYEKYGFIEVPIDPGHYERANIKMEKTL